MWLKMERATANEERVWSPLQTHCRGSKEGSHTVCVCVCEGLGDIPVTPVEFYHCNYRECNLSLGLRSRVASPLVVLASPLRIAAYSSHRGPSNKMWTFRFLHLSAFRRSENCQFAPNVINWQTTFQPCVTLPPASFTLPLIKVLGLYTLTGAFLVSSFIFPLKESFNKLEHNLQK